MAQAGPESKKEATLFSDILGTTIAAFAKLTLFQPIDTVTTNAMMGSENLKHFKDELKKAPVKDKLRKLYKGGWVELLKKGPSNAYRYPTQSAMAQYLQNHYGEKFVEMFGDYSDTAVDAASGGATAFVEPFLFQGFDTVQIQQQIYQKTMLQTYRGLTLSQMYRGVFVTSLFRNLPSGLILFGGSNAFNKAMNNEKGENAYIDLAAKTVAGLGSVAASQPADVLKTQMQANQWSFSQAVRNVTARQLLTNGSAYRFFGVGIRIGVGFFLAKKAMETTAYYFGKEEPCAGPSEKIRRP